MTDQSSLSRPDLLGVILGYAVLASLWIFISDSTVEWFIASPGQRIFANIVKGWLFVAVTALLLYGLLRRLCTVSGTSGQVGRTLGLPFLVLATAIVVVTGFAIGHTWAEQWDRQAARLQAVADLKATQLGDWLLERQGNAEFIKSSPYLAQEYRRWQEGGDATARSRLESRLEQLSRFGGFSAVSLLDPAGHHLIGTSSALGEPVPQLVEAARRAGSEGRVQRLGPYRGLTGHLHLDFVAPLGTIPAPSPLIVLHLDPAERMFPALQTWPMLSASGETVLFRRDGDQVRFLDELRFLEGSAAEFRRSFSDKELLAAEGVRASQADRLRALALLGAIADSSDDAIFAKDLEGRYLLFNRAASRFVGKPAEEVLGRGERAIFPPEQAELLRAVARRVIAEDRLQTQEEVLTTTAGERVFLATKGPLRDSDGKVVGVFGISRDITERKRDESALRARNEELERFNHAAVGRELAMIRLKGEVNALAVELGREPPYSLAFLESPEPPGSGPGTRAGA